MISAGIRVANPEGQDDDPVSITDAEFASYQPDPTVVAVVGGVDFMFTYRKLCIANLYL